MKKFYSEPATEITEVEGAWEISCQQISGVDPDNSGGNNYDGSGNSGTYPLD